MIGSVQPRSPHRSLRPARAVGGMASERAPRVQESFSHSDLVPTIPCPIALTGCSFVGKQSTSPKKLQVEDPTKQH